MTMLTGTITNHNVYHVMEIMSEYQEHKKDKKNRWYDALSAIQSKQLEAFSESPYKEF